jgi:8-oxo-dGTP pyrophosphatase MutT (NUDIX family)
LQPRRKWWRRWARRSAVALLLRDGDAGLEALMIRRAERVGDRWSGHMAFPGGVKAASDRNTLAVAARETHEEIGLAVGDHAYLHGRLSDVGTVPHLGQRRPMVVTPYVFGLRSLPPLCLNHEVADVLWVPLAFLADHRNRDQMVWRNAGVALNLPYYLYGGQRIWGLSLMMLDELIEQLRAPLMVGGQAAQKTL